MNTAQGLQHAQCTPVIPTTWLTAPEAAEYLKVSPRTVVEWAREGRVRAYQLSGVQRHVWRFRQLDLDEMMVSPAVLPTKGRIQ